MDKFKNRYIPRMRDSSHTGIFIRVHRNVT